MKTAYSAHPTLSLNLLSRSHATVRRVRALAWGEALMLRRNAMALVTAIGGPLLLVASQVMNSSTSRSDVIPGLDVGALLVTSLAAFSLIFGVYYNLVGGLVSRRESLVLKRLRTGEIEDVEILVAMSIPAIAISLAQIVVGILAGFVFLGMGIPTNPVLVVVAVALGTVVFVLLAAASTALTRSVEMAPWTATPLLLGSMVLSGLMFPLDVLPAPVRTVAEFLPLTPVVDLFRLGFAGVARDGHSVGLAGSFTHAALPVVILVVWVVAAGWAARRWFHWEPRG